MNKSYSKYKSVNQKWVKQIPVHWDFKRVKLVFGLRKETNNPIITDNILSLTAKQGVIPYAEKKGTGGNKPKADLTKYNICRTGDLLVNNMNVVSGAAGVSRYTGAVSPVYYPLVIRHNDNVWYYHYVFRLLTFQRSLIGLGKGILMHENDNGTLTSVRMRISMDYLGNVLLPVPPRAEQDQIVRFLDWKVSEINKLIGIRRKEIQELEEYRAVKLAFTTHYGVNKSRKIKDSGYSWIGGVPDDWHVRAFSKVAVVKSNLVQPENYMDEMQVSPASIEKNTGKIIQTQTVRESGIISGNHRFYKGQILYSKVRPLLNKVTIAPFDGLCSADMYPIETTLDTKYFVYFMLSQNFLGQLSMSGNRVKMPKINQDELSSILILFPDIKEQEHIVTKLDQLFALVDDQIERIKQDISLLQELKSVVISNTVTGKIDVRNIPVPAYEHVDDLTADDGEGNDEETGIPGEED